MMFNYGANSCDRMRVRDSSLECMFGHGPSCNTLLLLKLSSIYYLRHWNDVREFSPLAITPKFSKSNSNSSGLTNLV